MRQAQPHAGPTACLTGSRRRQFTSQADRLAWDCLPRSIGGSRVTHSCVPSPASLGSGLGPAAVSSGSPARGPADASRRLRAAHLGGAKCPGRWEARWRHLVAARGLCACCAARDGPRAGAESEGDPDWADSCNLHTQCFKCATCSDFINAIFF